jgi:hypothetical protein
VGEGKKKRERERETPQSILIIKTFLWFFFFACGKIRHGRDYDIRHAARARSTEQKFRKRKERKKVPERPPHFTSVNTVRTGRIFDSVLVCLRPGARCRFS